MRRWVRGISETGLQKRPQRTDAPIDSSCLFGFHLGCLFFLIAFFLFLQFLRCLVWLHHGVQNHTKMVEKNFAFS